MDLDHGDGLVDEWTLHNLNLKCDNNQFELLNINQAHISIKHPSQKYISIFLYGFFANSQTPPNSKI